MTPSPTRSIWTRATTKPSEQLGAEPSAASEPEQRAKYLRRRRPKTRSRGGGGACNIEESENTPERTRRPGEDAFKSSSAPDAHGGQWILEASKSHTLTSPPHRLPQHARDSAEERARKPNDRDPAPQRTVEDVAPRDAQQRAARRQGRRERAFDRRESHRGIGRRCPAPQSRDARRQTRVRWDGEEKRVDRAERGRAFAGGRRRVSQRVSRVARPAVRRRDVRRAGGAEAARQRVDHSHEEHDFPRDVACGRKLRSDEVRFRSRLQRWDCWRRPLDRTGTIPLRRAQSVGNDDGSCWTRYQSSS